ncbi:MAG: hypothetical protein HY874_07105 [Chloroflexi bacterium]|nr:hypothetical protein [Chloroflexota bacterium]
MTTTEGGTTDSAHRGCFSSVIRVVRVGAFAAFLIAFIATLFGEGRVDSPNLVGMVVFGTEVVEDFRSSKIAGAVVYALSLALVIGTAASTGHWILAAVIVGATSTMRLGLWCWRTRSRRLQSAAATEPAR